LNFNVKELEVYKGTYSGYFCILPGGRNSNFV
jgi:hypothetical protein